MSVTDPNDAFDTSMSTFAEISNVLGLACFAQETLTFNQTAKAGDQIVIYFGTGSGLLNLSLLSNATIQAKLSGANVDDPVALNNGLLNLQLLPGNEIAVIRYTLPGDTNQVRIQVGGLLSLLVNLRVYDVRLDFAKPTVTNGLTQTVCSGNSLNLSATPVAGTSLAWYSSATSTTPLVTGNSYTTPNLTVNTTYYLGVTRAVGCEGSDRIPVQINVSNPVAPVISASGTSICSSGATQQTTLSVVNPIPGTTYNWYNVASNGVSLASGNTFSPTVPQGTTSFYVEAAIGSCLSPARTQVDVISTAIPSVPTVLTQSVTIQSGQNATLNATTSEAGVTLNWYDVASGGSAIAVNSPTFTTPILTASKTYYVESQSATGNCVSARVPVVVNVIPSALGGCLEAGSQQTLQNGLCLLCGVTNPNNSVDGNSATATRLTVPVGLINGWIQQTLQFNNPGRAGDIVDVELELPGGLADVALLGVVSLATYNGATYNNDRVLINNSLVTLQLLSGNRFKASVEAGAAFDRVEIRLGGLAAVLTSLDIYQATYRYKSPAGLANRTICSGQTTTITANIGVGETINWFDVASGGTSLASTTSYTTPALTVPTTYYVEITRNGCVNSVRFPVLISIDNPIAPVIGAAGTTICSGQTTTLNIQAPVVGTIYRWYDAATAGNLVFTGTSFVTPNLTANTNYFVEASIGSCVSATRTSVTVTVNPLPAAPIAASSNVVIQSGQSVALQVSSPDSNVTFDWYDVPTNGTALATGTNIYTTPALTLNKTYYVTARGITSGCTSSARTAINVLINNSASSCLKANSQVTTLDPGLLCVLCSFTDPGGSVDTNPSTFTRLSTVAGIAGAYVEQVVTFPTTGQAGDIIDVELELPGGLADVSLLGGISLATYNGVTYNNDRHFLTDNLLSLQLLSGDRFKASFTATATFNKVEIRLGGLVTLLTNLDIYGASYRFKDAVITGATSPICSGQTANLAATSSVAGETFKWYDAASAGTELSSVATYTTPALTATTTYYVEATRDGTCINSVRQPVTVTVSPFATAADVTINTPLEASCSGSVVLSPTSALVGAQFKYYTDQNKTQEIITGSTVVAQPGVTFSKNSTTGALTINGLSSAVPSYNYYVSVVNAVTCENAINTLKQVTVNSPSVTPLTVIGTTLEGCGTVNLANAITGFDTTGNTTYIFYDPSDNILPAAAAANINTSGVYSIQAQGNGVTCPSGKLPVTVSVNPLPSLVVATPFLSVNAGTNVLLNATSNGTLAWFDPQGNALTGPVFTTGVLNTPGIYTYTVVATSALNCSTSATITINVIDPNSCQLLTERVYATGQSSGSIVTGGVADPTNAIDGNMQTYSTITTGVGLLGVGTTWQNLTWPANIAKGTPVTVKLGAEYSLLAVAQGLSVIGTKSGVDIGTMIPVSGAFLNLLPGEKSYEFTFVPSNGSGPQDYDGIRVISGALLSVIQNTKVFDAYYTKKVSTVACTPGDIQDVFYGATDLGLPIGALTSTVGVSDAWNVADNDVSTYATMYSGAGVLAAADLTVTFKTPSIVSDTLRLVVSKPGTLLDVNLLTGFSIQRYLGNVAVGAPIQNNSTLLSIRLLPGNTMSMVLVSSLPEAYDRVRIRFGGVAGVLDFLRVHTVERVANTKVIGSDPDNKITVCPGTDVTLQIPTDACSNYIWYDSPIGGSVVANGITFTVPSTLAAGIYKYYVQPVRYNCEALSRGEVTVEVRASSPENALTNITLNGGVDTSICSPTGTVTLNTSLSGTPSLTNPIYYWYNFDGTTSQLIAGETTSQLIRNGLTPGTYTYFVGVSSDEFCETAEADRKQITFTILPPSNQNDILVDDAVVCHNVPAVLTPTSTLTNKVFYWYFDANKTQPITNGTISGVTYTISSTGVLTVTGLTRAVSPVTYYVGVSSDTTCENIAGTLQTATVIINDPDTPTTTDNTQDFCLVNTPTVANIQVNESNVVWYDSLTSTTAIAPTTALTNGIYYGAILDPVTSCESSVRLQVTISVNDPGTPTTTDDTQDFCLVNAPTVASIQVNEANVVWYDSLTSTTAIAPTTALANGIYYGAILDPITNCESAVRLQVTITINDPGTPTTIDNTQDFCLVNAPTVANIQVNEANVVWYNSLTSTTAIAPTTALANGIYYGAILDPITNCESAVRLQVTITINDPGTPTTTDSTQDFCLINAPTVASIQVNEANVVWYNSLTSTTAIAPTTALTNGIYYGAILDPVTSCESSVRLQVTITINDPGTPTTTDSTQDFCLVNAPTVANIQVNEANVVWYNSLTSTTAIAPTTALANGIYYGAILDPITGCESSVRLQVTITVNDPGTPTTADNTQDFCLINAPTVASIQVNEANVVWYDSLTSTIAIAPTTTLANGIYYGAILDPVTGCESAVRLQVTISVNDPGTPTTTDNTQDFCLVNAPTVASIQVNEANVVWYDSLTSTTAIAPTTALANGIYYGAILDPVTGCESAVRLQVTATINDPGTPTTTDDTQDFCLVNAPTVASIQVNEANVVWYDSLTSTTVIAPTTALANGIYYGAILDPVTGCESAVRLQVTATINDPGTPTTADNTQDFCLVNAPTVANIQVNEANVVWYDSLTSTTALAPTTALVNGIYYGAILDPVTGCESAVRLQVTISVNDPGTPTTADNTQDFCLVNAPTVASIQVNEVNVVWYDSLTSTTAIAPTTALANGIYYGAILDPVTGCESAIRLQVTITVTDPLTPTTADNTQDFCLVNAPTVASIQVNEANVVWYNSLTSTIAIAPTTALVNGIYYGAILDPVTGCQSSVRLQVTISVNDPGTPTTTDNTQDFCLVNAPTVASIQVNEANVVWYNSLTSTTAIAPTTALANGIYYGAILDPITGCQSAVRLQVTVTVTNPATPTTTDNTQDFCIANSPTVANIQVNEANVVWYGTLTGVTPLAPTTALINGIYYGVILNPMTGCESSTRLQVSVTINNPTATPTTNSATQNFCSLNAPTVANIQVNEANVVWYSNPSGGTALASITPLATGLYYGAISSTIGCENPVRLIVTVNVNTPGMVTTTNTSQKFCLSKTPTIADIQVNETNVVWYSNPTGGVPLAANTALTATTYYATLLSNITNGCTNATRLAIAVSFENDALYQITSTDDTPCVFQGVTYSIANGKSNYVWSVTNGTITSGGGTADGTATISWSDIGPGTVSVTYINICDETTTKILNVTVATCSDLTITNTVSNPTPNFGDEVTFTITVNNVGQGIILNTLVSELIPSGYELVSSSTTTGVYDPATQIWTIPTLNPGESETLEVRVIVLPNGNYLNVATIEISTPLDVDPTNNSASASVEPICLTVYNEFTPNNDGSNDLFRIDCIESYPNNELKVFNRYGALVYSKRGYENDWDGTANVSGVINRGDMLPTGTYFYVIEIGDGKVKKGWLSIMR
ncbi:Ig-like domain-containing protein [Flavobacterium ajazii]|uniref:Ig-like domain-containing protein n=1 Tax=Flavobacterium ajazii TaxID=2692318 RepID=UPI001FE89AE8|nr:gliding motility-associated C-terminal domain-containing protein [Flavobacterium ajazii]